MTLSTYRAVIVYLAVAGFCGLFSFVYEQHSNGVSSPWMVWLFAWPLLGGAIPCAVLASRPASSLSLWARLAYHGAVACCTVGACVTGVFQIYGTASVWTNVYWAAGILLLLVAVATGVAGRARKARSADPTGAQG